VSLMIKQYLKARTAGIDRMFFPGLCALLIGLTLLAPVSIAQEPGVRPGKQAGDTALASQPTSQVAGDRADEGLSVLGRIYEAFYAVENWLVIGVVLLVGRLGGKLTVRLRTPMVVGYLLVGVLLGRSALNVISAETAGKLELITDFGLGIVAFMIGTELSRRLIRRLGAKLIIIMVSESLMAFIVVAVLVWGLSGWLLPVAGGALAVALIFGAMAPASAPAGTVAVIQEYRAKGPLTSLLLGIVGLDDAFAIMIYAFAAAIAKILLSERDTTFLSVVQGPCLEIAGGLLVGLVVGVVLLLLLRLRRGDHSDVLIYTVGAILLTTGLAKTLGLSLILANLAVGSVLANISVRDTEHAYREIERITAPIYVLFFVVAGAHLDLHLLATLSLLGPVYIVGRALGLIGGAYIGASLSGTDRMTRRYLGLGILSQAGVAVGLALTVANEFSLPEYGQLGRQLAELTINTIAATTIIFEIVGPITTKIALSKAGEIGRAGKARGEAS